MNNRQDVIYESLCHCPPPLFVRAGPRASNFWSEYPFESEPALDLDVLWVFLEVCIAQNFST